MARFALMALVALSSCGCGGDYVNLGHSSLLNGGESGHAGGSSSGSGGGATGGAVSREWSAPLRLFAQEEGVLVSNPSFNEGEDFVVYTEELRGDDELSSLYARALVGGAWSGKSLLEIGADAVSPALSLEGTLLWFGQNVDGGLGETDIWLSRLQGSGWSPPEHLGAPLNSEYDDVPRPPALNGTIMPLSSKRHGGIRYQIYLATRPASDQPWQDVSSELLGAINSNDYESVDGFLTRDGLTLYFASTRNAAQRSDLFVAQRSTLQASFGEPAPLDVNTEANERDPWLSDDGRRLYFTSDRATADYAQFAIYVSERAR